MRVQVIAKTIVTAALLGLASPALASDTSTVQLTRDAEHPSANAKTWRMKEKTDGHLAASSTASTTVHRHRPGGQ